jgi:hypothetical protein
MTATNLRVVRRVCAGKIYIERRQMFIRSASQPLMVDFLAVVSLDYEPGKILPQEVTLKEAPQYKKI